MILYLRVELSWLISSHSTPTSIQLCRHARYLLTTSPKASVLPLRSSLSFGPASTSSCDSDRFLFYFPEHQALYGAGTKTYLPGQHLCSIQPALTKGVCRFDRQLRLLLLPQAPSPLDLMVNCSQWSQHQALAFRSAFQIAITCTSTNPFRFESSFAFDGASTKSVYPDLPLHSIWPTPSDAVSGRLGFCNCQHRHWSPTI